jgi:hypothetical protein
VIANAPTANLNPTFLVIVVSTASMTTNLERTTDTG